MNTKTFLRGTAGVGALVFAITSHGAQASAAGQQDDQKPVVTNDADKDAPTREQDIIVNGIRKSINDALEKKKNSKQIVDSVVAEDAGKLPDNNVVEALARVTGVQIDRTRGEGSSLTIRGLTDVQTTLNGNNTNLGAGRSLNLSDIPAELIKSVEVYKTRTADQVEGGIGGSVNIELRRPLDLKNGLTVAGSIRGVYSDNPKKVSPFASLLVAQRFDTGIGEIGLLANGSYQKNFYRETFVNNEGVEPFCCRFPADNALAGQVIPNTPVTRLPAGSERLAAPYRVNYGLEQGYNDRKALNLALQWKPTSDLDFVLEGGYLGGKNFNQYDGFALTIRDDTRLSNIQTQSDGVTLRSATISPVNPNGRVPLYLNSQATDASTYLYTTNAEMNWRTGIAFIHASAQYNWSKYQEYNVQVIPVLSGISSVNIDLDSDVYNGGGPVITLPGVNLGNTAIYSVDRFQDRNRFDQNKELAAQFDIELTTSERGLLRRLKTGMRFNHRLPSNGYGYRDGFPRTTSTINGVTTTVNTPLSDFPGGSELTSIGTLVPGADLTWLHIPGKTLLANADAIRTYIQKYDPANAQRFSTPLPPSDRGQVYRASENTMSAYITGDYAFDMGFPVEGTIGARIINTFGTSASTNFRFLPSDPGTPIIENGFGKGNYVDILPSVSAILHFTPKLQLRLSRTVNIQRPNFFDLRASAVIDQIRQPNYVYTGNPNLQPTISKNYDASLEYFFKDGSVSLAGFVKQQKGLLFYYAQGPQDLSRYGVNTTGFVESLYNSGSGTIIGLEGSANTFFRFLPGILRNFGVAVNGTFIPKATQNYPYPAGTADAPGRDDVQGLSRYTGNATLLYETPEFSTRVSYNYRSSYRSFVNILYPQYSPYVADTSRLDAAVNFTPVKFLTLSVEGTNLLRNDTIAYYGQDRLLPNGPRLQPRTVQASARFRF
jgi:TonB-dependent receptor